MHEGVEVAALHGERRLESMTLRPFVAGGQPAAKGPAGETVNVNAIFVFIGAEPIVDWLPESMARDKQGYVLTGIDALKSGKWPLTDREPCPLETTIPGLLAGGDVRAGSTKRVGFAVGDGSLAVTCVHKLIAIRN